MASVDDLFRRPNTAPKRKFADPTTSFNKSAKLANGSSARSSSRSQPPPPSVEEEGPAPPPEDEDDDMEAGPALPPDEDEEDDPEGEDEEGRFFGSGVTDAERQAMNIINANDTDPDNLDAPETIDLTWLKRTALSFERKINKNAELRAKYADDPLKFVSSEADLDSEIKTLSLLAEYPHLFPEFVKSGNIAISAAEVLEELTDEDTSATPEQWTALAKGLSAAGIIPLLVSNLSRLNETSSDADREAPTTARASVGQNRQYAAELLAILLQSPTNAQPNRKLVAEQDGVDAILQLLAPYRNHDPERDSDEEEFVENLFDCLTCLVEDEPPATKFLEAEGMELCLIMLREGKVSKSRALKVLDHGMAGDGAVAVCGQVVEAGGLKTLFGLLMKTKDKDAATSSSSNKKGGGLDRESAEHLINILASLLRYTPAESPARIRTLAKFVEREYEKTTRVVELRREYQVRLQRVDAQIEKERTSNGTTADEDDHAELEDEWLSRRLDAGLFSLQTLDVVLSWLAAEDGGARAKIDQVVGLAVLKQSLSGQLSSIAPETDRGRDTGEVLGALIACL
ncbi:Beta-catenin-like protein [Cyphellophora attinorum]|uniref:Beta-catenin-like protein n=1 Tax=Cyphellophora attinorum TaxID=1664694 RepID=A0A0N1GY28_9EURO|nr:Beta-catenin-like protein [Phialophora attinorum]KPI35413.1 Beta-catenin-like protein [Phialophora attinorum]